MFEQQSFSPEERKQVSENARVVVVQLAERTYTLFDELLRRTNKDLADFDPLGEQYKGNMEPHFAGLRPGYSKDWGGGFGFFAAVMEQQRVAMKRSESNPDASSLRDLIDLYILTPDSGLVFAGAETPEITGILDFSVYQRHINVTNTQAGYTLKQVARTLENKSQDYFELREEVEFCGRTREFLNEIPMALRIFSIMRVIRDWVPSQLQQLNHPLSDELASNVLRAALDEAKDKSD